MGHCGRILSGFGNFCKKKLEMMERQDDTNIIKLHVLVILAEIIRVAVLATKMQPSFLLCNERFSFHSTY